MNRERLEARHVCAVMAGQFGRKGNNDSNVFDFLHDYYVAVLPRVEFSWLARFTFLFCVHFRCIIDGTQI